jgi:hypothetical protein
MLAATDVLLFCALVSWFVLGIVIGQVVLTDTTASVVEILED